MIALSGEKRRRYARFQPTFWREAPDSDAKQAPFFESLIAGDTAIVRVHERDGAVNGFVIATLMPAPPVYDPGGLTCAIDDFCVAREDEWPSIGRALLDAVFREATARGAVQSVVVCGHLDQPKREALAALGFSLASEWYVRGIA